MKIMHLTESEQGLRLTEGDAPVPIPGPGELLVRVLAAGVTPTELTWYPTLHNKAGSKRSGAVPGHEFSGLVAQVGKNVNSLEIGQEVFGMNDWFADGATAEYCIAPFSSVAPKPSKLTHVEAASVPIGALTAWQGLLKRANLQAGERVLVHGGSGAVGVFAVQLGKLHGATVSATASGRNLDFIASLGADVGIDYETSSFEKLVGQVDVVFDTVGGETLDRSWSVLKPGGRMVTVAANGEDATDSRVKAAFFIVEPNQEQLSKIADLLQSGRLCPVVDTVVGLSKAADAYARRIPRKGRGKAVIDLAV